MENLIKSFPLWEGFLLETTTFSQDVIEVDSGFESAGNLANMVESLVRRLNGHAYLLAAAVYFTIVWSSTGHFVVRVIW